MFKFYLFTTIWCLASGTPTTQDQVQFEVGTRPKVIKTLGSILKPVGFLGSGGESIFSSVFLDVPVPKMPKYDCRRDKFANCTITEEDLTSILQAKPAALHQDNGIMLTKDSRATQLRVESLTDCVNSCLQQNCDRIGYNSKLSLCRLNYLPPSQYSTIFKKAIERGDEAVIQWGWNLIEVEQTPEIQQYCDDHFEEPSLAKIYRQSANAEIEKLWASSNTTFINLKKAFQLAEPGTNSNSDARKKRGATVAVAAAIGLPLVGLGITFWESFQIRKYVKKLEKKFNEFAEETTEFLQKQVVFNREFIKVYEKLENQVGKISCNVDIVSYEVLRARKFQEWKTLTKTLLSGILKNKLTMPVLPEILSLEYIKQLTNNTMFLNTIYKSNPNSVLTLGRMTIVGLKRLQNSWRYHFVLILPTLRKESIYNRYTVEQVGVEANGTCIQFEMAEEVYEIEGKFYEVLDEQCYEKDNTLKICLKPSSEKVKKEHTSASCLNKEESCKVKVVGCEDKISFSVAGLLAYSKNPVKGISKQSGDGNYLFEVLSRQEQKTNFYSWENYSHILVGERLIQSLQKPLLHVEIEPSTELPSWEDFVSQTAIQTEKANLTKLLQLVDDQQDSLQRLVDITSTTKQVSNFFEDNWWNWAGNLAAYAGIILWLITIIINCCRARKQKESQTETRTNVGSNFLSGGQPPININISKSIEENMAGLRKRRNKRKRGQEEYEPVELVDNRIYYDQLDRNFEESSSAPKRMAPGLANIPMTTMPRAISGGDNHLTKTEPKNENMSFRPQRASSPIQKPGTEEMASSNKGKTKAISTVFSELDQKINLDLTMDLGLQKK